jgi:uncharacterized membrane protein HdeD (DUF308 family)
MSTTTMNTGLPPSASDDMKSVLAQYWWLIALRGVLGILFGIIALVMPVAAILALVLLFSAYMLVDGVMAIVSAVGAARHGQRWGLLTFEGIVNILTGVVAFLWPGLTVIVFVTLIAAWAIISGALMLAAAFKLGADHGRWWIALGGIASIVFGALLIIAPLLGAVVLTWWIGAYAIVFGVTLLVAAFKLRQRVGNHREGQSTTPAQSA